MPAAVTRGPGFQYSGVFRFTHPCEAPFSGCISLIRGQSHLRPGQPASALLSRVYITLEPPFPGYLCSQSSRGQAGLIPPLCRVPPGFPDVFNQTCSPLFLLLTSPLPLRTTVPTITEASTHRGKKTQDNKRELYLKNANKMAADGSRIIFN